MTYDIFIYLFIYLEENRLYYNFLGDSKSRRTSKSQCWIYSDHFSCVFLSLRLYQKNGSRTKKKVKQELGNFCFVPLSATKTLIRKVYNNKIKLDLYDWLNYGSLTIQIIPGGLCIWIKPHGNGKHHKLISSLIIIFFRHRQCQNSNRDLA